MSHLQLPHPLVASGQEGGKSLRVSKLRRVLLDLPELAASLLLLGSEPGRPSMLQAIRRAIALPQVPMQALAAVVSVLAFGWLLINDLVQPIVILLLELFLTF
jgi:hypothetical protein